MLLLVRFIFFFFQAEDGIRDKLVTGVRRVLFRSADSDAAASAAHRPVGRPLLVPPRGMPGDARVDREVKHIKGKNERDGRRGQRKGSATIHEPNVVRNFRTSEFAYARATSPGGGPLRLSAPIVLASSSIRRHQQSIHYRPERQ